MTKSKKTKEVILKIDFEGEWLVTETKYGKSYLGPSDKVNFLAAKINEIIDRLNELHKEEVEEV